METEVYSIQPKNGSDIQELAKDGAMLSLREELGLPELQTKEAGGDFFRFRKMTEDENKVFSVLFPVKTKVAEYKELIPLEALQALKEFQDTCPHVIHGSPVVWHARDYDPDPILSVEVKTDPNNEWARAVYLVARWGEALLPMEQLERMAFDRWKNKRVEALRKGLRDIKVALEDAEEALTIGTISDPYISV